MHLAQALCFHAGWNPCCAQNMSQVFASLARHGVTSCINLLQTTRLFENYLTAYCCCLLTSALA